MDPWIFQFSHASDGAIVHLPHYHIDQGLVLLAILYYPEFITAETGSALLTMTSPENPQPNDIPDEFICPITQSPMRNPVIDLDGNTWEREAILEWIAASKTSPKTGNPMSPNNLFPNRALRNLIAETMGSDYVIEDDNIVTPSFSHRQTINKYLTQIGESVGKDLSLNEKGIKAFTFDGLMFVIEVPEKAETFFIYTILCNSNSGENKLELLESAMRMNYLQQKTRGGSIGIDPENGDVVLSYSDRVAEINAWTFRNILENFIQTAMDMHKTFLKKLSGDDDNASGTAPSSPSSE